MPRGYLEVKTVDQCDASGLLNLINFCDCFQSVDVDPVREVIICRASLTYYLIFKVPTLFDHMP